MISHVFLKNYFVKNGWVEARTDLRTPDWRLLRGTRPEKMVAWVMILAVEGGEEVDRSDKY